MFRRLWIVLVPVTLFAGCNGDEVSLVTSAFKIISTLSSMKPKEFTREDTTLDLTPQDVETISQHMARSLLDTKELKANFVRKGTGQPRQPRVRIRHIRNLSAARILDANVFALKFRALLAKYAGNRIRFLASRPVRADVEEDAVNRERRKGQGVDARPRTYADFVIDGEMRSVESVHTNGLRQIEYTLVFDLISAGPHDFGENVWTEIAEVTKRMKRPRVNR